MKNLLRTLFSPLLNRLESGNEPYAYKASHRSILMAMSAMFAALAAIVFFRADGADLGYLFPVIVFGAGGVLGLIIGWLGDDRAVAKIWGTGK